MHHQLTEDNGGDFVAADTLLVFGPAARGAAFDPVGDFMTSVMDKCATEWISNVVVPCDWSTVPAEVRMDPEKTAAQYRVTLLPVGTGLQVSGERNGVSEVAVMVEAAATAYSFGLRKADEVLAPPEWVDVDIQLWKVMLWQHQR